MIADPVFADMLHGPAASSSTSSTPTEGHSHDHAHVHEDHEAQDEDQDHNHDHTHGEGHSLIVNISGGRKGTKNPNRDSEQEKVRSTLRSFVRDWSKEGEAEREACYTPILEALERQWPKREVRGRKKVLIPGSGLGRLAMEVAARGELSSSFAIDCSLCDIWVRGDSANGDRVLGSSQRI